jgi:hypothetical protein
LKGLKHAAKNGIQCDVHVYQIRPSPQRTHAFK